MPDRSPSKLPSELRASRASRRYVKGEEQESNPPSRRARRWGTRKSTEGFFDYPPRPEIVTPRFPSETGWDAPLRMTNRDAGRGRARGFDFCSGALQGGTNQRYRASLTRRATHLRREAAPVGTRSRRRTGD